MYKVAEVSPRAPQWSVKVSARHSPVIAGLNQNGLTSRRLLLLLHRIHCRLSLLSLRLELDRLHCRNSLLLFALILSFYMEDGVFDHLKELLVRHAGVVAEQIHDLFTLTYKRQGKHTD